MTNRSHKAVKMFEFLGIGMLTGMLGAVFVLEPLTGMWTGPPAWLAQPIGAALLSVGSGALGITFYMAREMDLDDRARMVEKVGKEIEQ